MCELFGLSGKQPTTVQTSLSEFARRGGATGPHTDGWGVAFFCAGGDVLLIREPEPSAHSAHLRFIHDQHVPSPLVISHIRRATQGSVCLRNTQPFTRELGGRAHVFAHNGDLGTLRQRSDLSGTQFRTIGDTDSEFAFCYLMGLLQPLWCTATPPNLEQRLAVFGQFSSAMVEFGEANFLYSDGDYLFVHSHRRRQDNGQMCPPGLHMLARSAREHAVCMGTAEDAEQAVIMLASVPLTTEDWQPLPEHTVMAIRGGHVVAHQQLHSQTTNLAIPA